MRLTLGLLLFCPVLAAGDGEGWTPLFNGRDLDGWTVKITGHELGDNWGDTFRVEDGLLKVSYDRYHEFDGRFGHLFYYGEHSDYALRVEYRFVGEQVPGAPDWAFRNGGVMIHGQTPASMSRDQEFPVSIEVQLLGDDGGGDRPTANLCTPGTHVVMDGELVTRHCTMSASRTYPPDEWVTVVIEARGDSIRHLIDGEVVLEYRQPRLDEDDPDARRWLESGGGRDPARGTISIQSESHPMEFRRIELRPLPVAGER